MSLEANNGVGVEKEAGVEPLFFRSIEDFAAVLEPVFAEQEAAAQDVAASFDFEASLRAAHEQGRLEAMSAAAVEMEQQVAQERAVVQRFVAQFEQEKQRYFSEVESEVVRLSLAIAERVLHREASMDPMLLAGAARVALENVADNSETVLRVPESEAAQWNSTLLPAGKNVAIEPDADLERGEAVLKTRSGTVQLGLKAQLQEIERGFFELLNRRPAMAM